MISPSPATVVVRRLRRTGAFVCLAAFLGCGAIGPTGSFPIQLEPRPSTGPSDAGRSKYLVIPSTAYGGAPTEPTVYQRPGSLSTANRNEPILPVAFRGRRLKELPPEPGLPYSGAGPAHSTVSYETLRHAPKRNEPASSAPTRTIPTRSLSVPAELGAVDSSRFVVDANPTQIEHYYLVNGQSLFVGDYPGVLTSWHSPEGAGADTPSPPWHAWTPGEAPYGRQLSSFWEMEQLGYGERRLPSWQTSDLSFRDRWRGFVRDLRRDHRNFYSGESLMMLYGGIGGAALLAHTDADVEINTWWQNGARTGFSDEVADIFKFEGNAKYIVPVYAAAIAIRVLAPEQPLADKIGEWSRRSIRATIVGLPPMLFMQSALGASRPNEAAHRSQWAPFSDDNGVSGHAFIGVIPFLIAAEMSDDLILKTTLYAASSVSPLMRINDENHYASQAVIGWWMAYLSCRAVAQTEQVNENFRIVPLPMPQASGVGIVIER